MLPPPTPPSDMDRSICPEHRDAMDAFDSEFYRRRLLEDADRLFNPFDPELTVVFVASKPHNVNVRTVTDLTSLDEALMQLHAQSHSDVFIFIDQNHTWDYLQISLELAQMLLVFFEVFPPFLDYLHGFGRKPDETSEDYLGYRSIATSCGAQVLRSECCYNLRYPEKNGRPTGNPWSIRHSAVYVQYDPIRNLNIWIMIQPSRAFENQITDILFSPGFTPELVHAAFFQSSNRFWRDYINDLQKKLTLTEHKAFSSSKASVNSKHDYDLAFREIQVLQRLHQQVLRAQCLLDLSSDTAEKCQAGEKGMLTDYIDQVKVQKRVLDRLLGTSDHILQTLLPTLQCQNDEASQKASETISQHTKTIEMLAKISEQQSEAFVELNRRTQQQSQAFAHLNMGTQQDWRVVKIIAVVVSLYLPAALVAFVFGFNLVQTVPAGGMSPKLFPIQLAEQLWTFLVASLVLTIVTLIPVRFWLQPGKGRNTPPVTKAKL